MGCKDNANRAQGKTNSAFLFYLKRKRRGKRIFVSDCSMVNIKLQRFFALTFIKQRNAVMLARLPDVALRGNQSYGKKFPTLSFETIETLAADLSHFARQVSAGALVFGVVEHLVSLVVFDELAEVHEHGHVGDAHGLRHVVRHNHDGHFVFQLHD